ncbi:MAG: PilZ domain-containing protein, partial [Deltaproteobacteria bacterium]|nr:PilZ domain-containing protein [Deltaproteobacteria bacterium]
KATFIFSAGTVSVGVLDISEGGARLSLDRPPAVGSRAVLILGALPDRPSVPCVVRHYSAERHNVGVEFLADKKVSQRIATDMARRFASAEPVLDDPPEEKPKPPVAATG